MFKVTFNKKVLKQAIDIVIRATDDKVDQVIQGYILIEADNSGNITIKGIGGMLALKVEVPGTATEGATVLPARLFKEIVDLADADTIELVARNAKYAEIIAGTAKYKLPTLPVTSYPDMPVMTDVYEWINISAVKLREAIRSTSFSVAQDNPSEAFNAFLWDSTVDIVSLVATDTYKLGYYQFDTISASTGVKMCIPARTIKDIIGLLPSGSDEIITIKTNGSLLSVDFPGTSFISRLIDEQYADWQAMVPTMSTNFATIDRNDVIKALGRVKIIAQMAGNYVKLTFGNNLLKLEADDKKGICDEELVIQYTGTDNFEVFFEIKDLLSGFQSFSGSELKLEMTTQTGVIKVTDSFSEDSCFQLFAPLLPK